MMPFSAQFNIYYQQLYRPAIEAADMEPVRADDLFRSTAIVSDLWAMIREAKILVAELTTKNANVFYELGLAHAIGKPVILVSETAGDVPYDLQQLRVLSYDRLDPAWGARLAKSLTTAIRETLADPVEAVPSIFRRKVAPRGPRQDATQVRLDALENELRALRSDSFDPSRQNGSDAIHELALVSSPGAFEQWAKRWSERGLRSEDLQMMARAPGLSISRGQVARIPEIVKSHSHETLLHQLQRPLFEDAATIRSQPGTARTGRRAIR